MLRLLIALLGFGLTIAWAERFNLPLESLPVSTQIGAAVYDLKHNKSIYNLNSSKLMNPASTVKIFTAYAALNNLGSDYKFITNLIVTGKIVNQVLIGDLWLEFSGDPSLTTKDLTNLFKRLNKMGVSRVNGNIYIFRPKLAQSDYAPGWMLDDISHCYSSPVNGLILNQNCAQLYWRYSKNKGFMVDVSIPHGVRIKSLVVKKSKCKGGEVIKISSLNDGYLARGCLAKNSFVDEVAVKNIDQWITQGVKLSLQQAKINLHGNILIKNNLLVNNTAVLFKFKHYSVGVGEMLSPILKNSNNLFASRIFLALGDHSWSGAAKIITKQISRYATPVLIDGSGLSRLNQASADDINNLLVNVVKDNHNFSNFFKSLAILGYDGTLKHVIVQITNNQSIVGKTGSMAGVDAIAGFIVVNGNPYLAYTLILNGRVEDKKLRLKARNNWLALLANYANKLS